MKIMTNIYKIWLEFIFGHKKFSYSVLMCLTVTSKHQIISNYNFALLLSSSKQGSSKVDQDDWYNNWSSRIEAKTQIISQTFSFAHTFLYH